MPSYWKFASASVVGTSHTKGDGECQDASAALILHDSDGNDIFVAIASDGAGSAPMSQTGSKMACSLFVSEVQAFFDSGASLKSIDRTWMSQWLEYFQSQLRAHAEVEGGSLRDYACTFLAAIIGDTDYVFAQIGDGAIVISTPESPDDYHYVYWPQKGEYENMTFFATDANAANQMEFDGLHGTIDEVAIFTDGIQRLALDFTQQEPYAPFFRPMFSPLRAAEIDEKGLSAGITNSLQQYLNSSRINDRTDDDKTLILATRCLV